LRARVIEYRIEADGIRMAEQRAIAAERQGDDSPAVKRITAEDPYICGRLFSLSHLSSKYGKDTDVFIRPFN